MGNSQQGVVGIRQEEDTQLGVAGSQQEEEDTRPGKEDSQREVGQGREEEHPLQNQLAV